MRLCVHPDCGGRHDLDADFALRSISYGGGVQSTALLALAAAGQIDYRRFLFANVGDDSEHPDTLVYVREVARPFAELAGLEVLELHRWRRDGKAETLRSRLMREESRSLPIPVRMSNGAPGNRSCTSDFKIKVIGRWLKAHGASAGKPCKAHRAEQKTAAAQWAADELEGAGRPVPASLKAHPVPACVDCEQPVVATVGIGISLDEIQRANSRHVEPYEKVVYPLVGIGEETGLKLRRDDCMRVIRETPLPPALAFQLRGRADLLPQRTRVQLEMSDYTRLPIPPKSSCYFCPFHKPGAWQDLHRERPDLFADSVAIEATLNERRDKLGKDHVYLTRFAVPLDEAIATSDQLLPMFDETDESCDSGYCFT